MDQIAANLRVAPQTGRALVNIARTGVAPGGECTTSIAPGHSGGGIATRRDRDVVGWRASGRRRRSNDSRRHAARAGVRAGASMPDNVHVGQNLADARHPAVLRGTPRPARPGANGISTEGPCSHGCEASRAPPRMFSTLANGESPCIRLRHVGHDGKQMVSGPTPGYPLVERDVAHYRRR